MIHRLETNKLRNVSKFFAHLLITDGLPWTCLEYIHLNEEETTSSSRIFIKILMQEVSESMGMGKLKGRFTDPYMAQVQPWSSFMVKLYLLVLCVSRQHARVFLC